VVVVPVMTQRYAMLQRDLLYTGITRGKTLVVLVGQRKAIAIAVRNGWRERPPLADFPTPRRLPPPRRGSRSVHGG
jgi:ATP-dependent exoDNAse (exonuclease V) alpha subunit